jgi:hypothetical protein
MKNAIKVICFVLAVLVIGTASGYVYFTWDVGEFETVEGSKAGTAIITDYIGEATEVVIPEKLRGKKIISIDQNAFKGSEITSVVVADTVTSIGSNAFQNCKKLTKVDMGKSVKNLGEGAFSNCPELVEVICSPTLNELGTSVFGNDDKLQTVNLDGNNNLIIKDGIIYTADMTKLVESLSYADLSSYVLPSTVVEINSFAFYNQKELTSISLNEGIETIPQGAFINCKKLREVTLPDSVVSIGTAAFTGSGVTNVNIPSSVKNINKDAFYNVEKQITITTTKGSDAEKFAKRNEMNLVIVDSF